ncbi:uncharacterized protein N7498_007901 [Penicillium cinerascens]|uniref:Uncharacterized protein n=1 Tax=Penicillium cinerascens TaxID=70096 RepID=A0A9W9JLY9_9EURO|nr:uncharacterized protein N7498_007901 [Penicillium cinerascens]KAJ5198784.1 hypothetical protein N7498_007901 [Penicillium cinerascens]
MRLRLFYPIAILFLVAYFFYRLVSFLQIFFEHTGISITQQEIKIAHATIPDSRPQYIPKIIHNVFHDWKNQSMPADWKKNRQNCIDLNPDWEHKLWSEEESRVFIEEHYHWFLRAYDGYEHRVQRIDALRYFLLRNYGGIYLDLDNGCLESLEPLLYYPIFTTDGGRGALSNNILGSYPHHPFWKLLTESLIPYDHNYLFPYVTISYASGQWFETAIWDKYHHSIGGQANGEENLENLLYRIMMDDRPGAEPWIFFTQERGGSWNNWDNRMFLWIGDHLALDIMVGVSCIGLLLWCFKQCARSCIRKCPVQKDCSKVRSVEFFA